MFTGIIEDLGKITELRPLDGGLRFTIEANQVGRDLKIGDSISVNGVCLTVVEQDGARFAVEAVGETLEKTTIGTLEPGHLVNLERPLAANGRFGGHIVQGHVNATGVIRQWFPRGENWFLEVELPSDLMRYVIREGSIAIEGISLTVAKRQGNRVGINIIPHTVKVTNLQTKVVGDPVNIEVDVLAKYLENLLSFQMEKFANQENTDV